MLFLFDIDGTLLHGVVPPIHKMAFCDAIQSTFGIALEPIHLGNTAGLMEGAIAYRVLEAAGVSPDVIVAGLPTFFEAEATAYDRRAPEDLRPYLTPHAAESLAWLLEHQAILGLVTGNIERIAWRKLAAAGLDTYFSFGAFGNEAESREELPPRAIMRAERLHSRRFAPDQVYVIGDTPADISCGVASKLRTIAVATGPEHSLAELLACRPDYALADLSSLYRLPLFAQLDTNQRAV